MRRRYLLLAMAGAIATVAVSLGPVTKVFAVGAVSQYVMSPKPIAAPGSLSPGANVVVSITAEDSTSTPVPGATVFVAFSSSAGASASVGGTTLSTLPQAFVANGSGVVSVSYTAASTIPLSGTDRIDAKNTASRATVSNHDEYSYSSIKKYTLKPKPIATAASLAANAMVSVTLRSISTSGGVAPNATVYLSFVTFAGGGSATVGTTTLTSTPQQFATDGSGALTIIYHASAAPPATGTDTVTAQNGAAHSTITSSDTYTY